MTSPAAPATDDAELIAELRRVARFWFENFELAIEWKAADRLEAIANRLSQEAVLRDALVEIGRICHSPEELDGVTIREIADGALTGEQSANLGHSISTGNKTPGSYRHDKTHG